MADHKALATRFYDEVFGKGDMDAFDELVDDSFVEHEEIPGASPDKAGLAAFVQTTREAFAPFSAEIVAVAEDGDEVWVQGVMHGTHSGEFLGIPPTGRTIAVPFFDRVRIRDDKAVEHWGVTDFAALMEQLGVTGGA